MRLPDPIPDLASLDLLASVADLGSISAAAAAHDVSQPAASMRLHRLERSLGIELLERTSQGSRVTPAGKATVEWAAAVIAAMGELVEGVAALRGHERSHLRVAASMTVAEYLFPGWLARLAVADPDVRVALEMGNSTDVAARVAHGDVDLGFVEGTGAPRGLSSRAVRHDRLVVIAPPGHPWTRRRRPLTPEVLAATPLVAREVGSGTRQVLDDALADHGLALSVAVELASTTAIEAAVAAGTAPAVVSELSVSREVDSGRLVVVACEGLDTTRTIRAVWHRGRKLSDPAATLVRIATGPRHSGPAGASARLA